MHMTSTMTGERLEYLCIPAQGKLSEQVSRTIQAIDSVLTVTSIDAQESIHDERRYALNVLQPAGTVELTQQYKNQEITRAQFMAFSAYMPVEYRPIVERGVDLLDKTLLVTYETENDYFRLWATHIVDEKTSVDPKQAITEFARVLRLPYLVR
jgi:hypothetical protein